MQTRVYIQTPATVSVGGGAVTRSWTTQATVHARIDEQAGIAYVRGVPAVATGYRIRLRKPIYTLTGTAVVPTTACRLVTVDETTVRTFHVSEVTGKGPRERYYDLACSEVEA